jgi:hypothetical protein
MGFGNLLEGTNDELQTLVSNAMANSFNGDAFYNAGKNAADDYRNEILARNYKGFTFNGIDTAALSS